MSTPVGIERIVITYLTPRLDGVWVATKVPNPRPEKLVRVEAAGGPRQNLRQDRSLITVQAWAQYDADLLMAQTRETLHAMPGNIVTVPGPTGFTDVMIYTVTEAAGPANFPDPDTGVARYQMTAEILHSH